jgi:hypothetical protein
LGQEILLWAPKLPLPKLPIGPQLFQAWSGFPN